MSIRLLIAVLIVSIVIGFYAQESIAQETAAKNENKVVQFFKNLVNWPFGVTKKSSEAVGKTAQTATDTVTATGTSAVQTVTGQPEKIKDVVVEPVKGSADTAHTAVKETVSAPVQATPVQAHV